MPELALECSIMKDVRFRVIEDTNILVLPKTYPVNDAFHSSSISSQSFA